MLVGIGKKLESEEELKSNWDSPNLVHMLDSFNGGRSVKAEDVGVHKRAFERFTTLDILVDAKQGNMKYILDGQDGDFAVKGDPDIKSGDKFFITINAF